jgi:hypothetical protein
MLGTHVRVVPKLRMSAAIPLYVILGYKALKEKKHAWESV